MRSGWFGQRLFSASDSPGSVKSGQRYKAAQASRLPLCGYFDQLALLQCVVRKYFGPHWSFGSAPRRNVVNALGHPKKMVALASNTAKAFPRLKGLTWFPAKRLLLGNLWVIIEADRSVTTILFL